MTAEIIEESISVLPQYENIPIAFRVLSRFRIEPSEHGLGGWNLMEEEVEPYIKDYDAIKGESPSEWPKRWDISNWGVLSAFVDKRRIGGVVIAWKTEGLNMLMFREDSCVIWDLRVHPDLRRSGIGNELFARAVDWARGRGCSQLMVETQDINVPACRFYARQGCELAAVDRQAYKDLDEVQLIWQKAI